MVERLACFISLSQTLPIRFFRGECSFFYLNNEVIKMTIGIYKIENLVNHKVYIGQSIHIEKRWQEHCRPSADSAIAKAIRKYGKENFSFQILEECSE